MQPFSRTSGGQQRDVSQKSTVHLPSLLFRLPGLLFSQIALPADKAQSSFLTPANASDRHTKFIVTSREIHLFSNVSSLG